MKFFDRTVWRVFLIAWLVFVSHFATNIVREHYPAFSLIEAGSLQVDRYEGFHSDIFVHTDGHAYICNQVGTSLLAAAVLLPFRPLLDHLEERQLTALAEAVDELEPAKYDSEYPARVEFYRKVKGLALELRFGAAVAILSALFMAPLAALLCVLVLRVLRERGVANRRAAVLALLFGLATPVLYRSAILSGNLVLTALVFSSALCLATLRIPGKKISSRRALLAGILAGYAIFVDYAAVVPLAFLFLYGWLRGGEDRVRVTRLFVLGAVPGFLLLFVSQWSMFGSAFLPAQSYMPDVNFTERGFRGLDWPSLDLFWKNVLGGNYGLFAFGPLLSLAFVPVGDDADSPRIVPRMERRFVWAFVLAFLVFCCANQYARMQWNTGFRYLLPLVPFLFLLASDRLSRVSWTVLWLVALPAFIHSLVLSQTRWTVSTMEMALEGNSVLGSWRMFWASGLDLPWLRVLRETQPPDSPLQWFALPYFLIGFVVLCCSLLWRGVPHDESVG